MRHFYSILIVLFLVNVSYGRSSYDAGMLLFETVSANNISLNSKTFTILHDPRGFTWLGTDAGLLRYDGYSAIRIRLPDPDHSVILATSSVETMVHGKDSSLWIGTSQGLINLNLNTWKTKRPEIFQKYNVRALLFQNDTCIWVGTNHGLYKYNPQNEQAHYFSQINSGLSQNVIRTLYMDHSENLWVGTADKLNVLYYEKHRFESFDLKGNYKPDINHNLILDIQSISAGNDSILFVGTETGLCLLNRYTMQVHTYNKSNCDLSNEVVKTIYIKSSEEIYFGTDLGFNKLNLQNGEVETYYHNPFNQHSIINNEIWKILPDHKGNLWLATSNGLSRLKTSADFFKYYPVYFKTSGEPIGTRVSDILFDTTGNCWVGTSNGLLRLNEHADSYEEYITSVGDRALSINNINTISIDHKNRIWIGSVAGLNIWDPVQQRMHIPPMDDASGFRTAANYISSIVPGYDNFFWIGTWGGGLFKAWSTDDQIEQVKISYVADFNGLITAGRDHLFALDGNRVSTFNINTEKVELIRNLKQHIGNMNFASICISAGDVLWLGAKNQLLKYSILEDSIEVIQMPIHEDFIVTGLIEDNVGMIWGSSNKTIFKFDPLGKEFKFFPVPEKIPLTKIIPFPFRKTVNGEILVCAYNGFLKFNPQNSKQYGENYPVSITAMRINGVPLYPTARLNPKNILPEVISNCPDLALSFENRNIEVEFSSFPYDHIEQERYAYMLAGYDDTWKLTKARSNSVTYNNLPPGKYVFKIKSATGNLHADASSLNIKVNRPVLAQPLWLVLYTLLTLIIIVFFIFQFIRIRREKIQMKFIQTEKDKNELIATSKTRFFINISHELLNSISLITYPLKNLLSDGELNGSIRKSLLQIEMNIHFLKAYIDQLLNFRTIELGHKIARVDGKLELISFCKQIVKLFKKKAIAKGVTLRFKSEIKELRIDTDEEKLNSILHNLLTNAITFTPSGGQVTVALRHRSSKEFIMEVKDNGIGIPNDVQAKVFERFYQIPHEHISNRGMGIGLTIVKDFAEVLNGSIEMKSLPGKGTSVKVILPSHYEEIQKLEEGSLIRKIVSRDTITNTRISVINTRNGTNGLPAVLVVDETIEFYEYIQSTFIDKYTIYWAPNGEEAMNFLNEKIPNIIISEIQLQGMDGITFCNQVRKRSKTNRIPFIFLTTNTDVDDQLNAIHAGVDVFLTKPCDISILEANFANLIRRVEKTEAFISQRLILNAPPKKIGSKDDKLLKEVVDCIHKNMTNSQLTAKEISYALGISHSNLYRRIKHMTDLSLNEFVRHVRLQNAERLLASGKLSVSEVMFEVGFTNHSYFSKCFKKLYNTTPKKYSLK